MTLSKRALNIFANQYNVAVSTRARYFRVSDSKTNRELLSLLFKEGLIASYSFNLMDGEWEERRWRKLIVEKEEHWKYFVRPFTRNRLQPLDPRLYVNNFKVFTKAPWWRNRKEIYPDTKVKHRRFIHKMPLQKSRIYFYRDHAFFLKILELYYTLLVKHGEEELFVLAINQPYLMYYDYVDTIPFFKNKNEALHSMYKAIMQLKYYSDRGLCGYEAVKFFYSAELESELIHFFERSFFFDLLHKDPLPYTRATMQLKLPQDSWKYEDKRFDEEKIFVFPKYDEGRALIKHIKTCGDNMVWEYVSHKNLLLKKSSKGFTRFFILSTTKGLVLDTKGDLFLDEGGLLLLYLET